MSTSEASVGLGIWSDLTELERVEIKRVMRVRRIARGETLIRQSEASETLFIVNFGLFEVRISKGDQTIAEIGAGQTIGEIGFFADQPRIASVIAVRDSEVLELDKASFEDLSRRHPKIQSAVTRSMAKRLSAMAEHQANLGRMNPMRTVAVIAGGSGRIPPALIERLNKAMMMTERTCVLTSSDARARLGKYLDGFAIASWLAAVEKESSLVIFIADDDLTDWTQTAIRSANQLVIVAQGQGGMPNPVETFAFGFFPPARRRLVRLHARRSAVASSSEQWTRHRPVFMIHHVAMEDEDDFQSLRRFLSGQAIGFVAGGGGAFGPAHLGIYKAFRERGLAFDLFGGTSVGAGMAAGFSLLMHPEEIEAAVHDIFVTSRAFKRFTLPIYSLIDHTALDRALQRRYGSTSIEDVWKPFFAVTTDLSDNALRVIRTGPLWQAVRASSAVPGVLPPVFDEAGHMLVDGAVANNVPLEVMRSLKTGPNVIVDFALPRQNLFDVDYRSIPGRWSLIGRMMNPWLRHTLPLCPSPASVVLRSIFADIRNEPQATGPHDLLLQPPPFPGSSYMDWDRHREVGEAAFRWCLETIDRLRAENHPAILAMENALMPAPTK